MTCCTNVLQLSLRDAMAHGPGTGVGFGAGRMTPTITYRRPERDTLPLPLVCYRGTMRHPLLLPGMVSFPCRSLTCLQVRKPSCGGMGLSTWARFAHNCEPKGEALENQPAGASSWKQPPMQTTQTRSTTTVVAMALYCTVLYCTVSIITLANSGQRRVSLCFNLNWQSHASFEKRGDSESRLLSWLERGP